MDQEIFKGLKVIELAGVLAGPAVGMFFAELGADVIKVENMTLGGDMTRSWKLASEKKDNSVSAYFSAINYNKSYLNKDLKDPLQRGEINELIKSCDIVIVNFKKGSDKKLGMDLEALSGINPKLIYAAIEGFVSDPLKVAFDLVLQAETGFMGMNGYPNEDPAKLPVALIDVLAAHQLKEAILIALLKRERTGKGSYVHVSLEEAALASLANQASNYLMEGHIPQKMGTLHPNIAPYGELFKMKDDALVVLAVGTNGQFKELCKILNCEALLEEELFETNAKRVINRTALKEKLEAYIGRLNSSDFIQKCIDKKVPVGKVKDMKEVMENPVAQDMILREEIDGLTTQRIRSVAFHIKDIN